MKGNRRHAFEPNFWRGRAISPLASSKEENNGTRRPVHANHNGKLKSRDRHQHHDSASETIASAAIDTASLLSPPHSLLSHKSPEASHPKLKIVIFGLSVESSWENCHASTYRGLVRELSTRGHDVLFLERHAERHTANHDQPEMPGGHIEGYSSIKDLKQRFNAAVREADFVMVGSSINDGIAIGEWVTRIAQGATAFYDIDTTTTMANFIRNNESYISPALIPRYQIYLSYTGGPLLHYLENHYGSPMARPLYCSVDAALYFPEERTSKWDLGYAGDYCDDRRRALDQLFLEPARRWGDGHFAVAGAQYPRSIHWPHNVKRSPRLARAKLREFYNSQRFALNLTHSGMAATGFSPGPRLLEAAACGVPVISDFWQGTETFFKPDEEILISHSADETLIYLEEISELDRRRMGYRARERVLAEHTTRRRAVELENYVLEVLKPSAA